mgnify:CR=1 FL=1
MSRPQDKNLIPLTERSEEEAHAIRSAGGKASQAARKKRTEQQYLLGKYAQVPVLDKRTIKKFERMGFENDEITRALEITDAIMKGAKAGDPRMIEIYLRLTGEDKPETSVKDNNLLEAIQNATKEDVNTDDLPELQQTAASDADVVE